MNASTLHRTTAGTPVLLGLVWGYLYFALQMAGASPASAVGLPVAADIYYGIAAAYALPVCVLVCQLFGWVCHRVAGLSSIHRDRLASAFALPLLVLLVVPEILVAYTLGHSWLKDSIRTLAPATLVGLLAWPSWLLRRHAPEVALKRRLAAVISGLLVASLPMALLLR